MSFPYKKNCVLVGKTFVRYLTHYFYVQQTWIHGVAGYNNYLVSSVVHIQLLAS